jgi:hypothetical protein
MSSIEIKKVDTSALLKKFIDFPHDLYKNDNNYVPELFISQKALLEKTSAFYKHSKADLFLAFKDGKIQGRIAAIRNNNHIAFTHKQEGFFGFFDVADDADVANALFDTVKAWMKAEGLTAIQGPANFSTNETCGLLVGKYDSPPVVMMTYNKPYYEKFIEHNGFRKKMDLLAYELPVNKMPPDVIRLANRVEERLKQKGITIRKLNTKDYNNEVRKVKEIYNAAWDSNWGFVPMTDAEFESMGKEMKMILDPDFALLAEKDGKVVAFSLSIPNINEILIKIPRGRLFPFGLFKILTGLKKVKTIRVIAMGVLQEHRMAGIDLCMYGKTYEAAIKKNIDTAEASWILEDNFMMNSILKKVNGNVYKTYRMYQADLS